ncbi:MAG TPA: c-type cytochrome, partial [Candidatus Dormibacteraeota bacterium]|nr:c-type cytochrome [Candidatus Dormibacteraeota bacterium]
VLLAFSVVPAFAADFTEPSNTFKKICSACHTFGKGIKVGPDLKGVTERRQRSWLLKFVRSSQTVILSGDPTATSLFAQFKQQKMPDRSDLSEQQISALMDYLAANGPDIKPADERLADTATPAEIETGRKLFYGETPLALGGQSCSSCHAIGGSGFKGGSLGPNLTTTFIKYQDKAMTDFLRHPCFLRVPDTIGNYLKPEESFALKAYMAQSAGIKATPVSPAAKSAVAPSASNSTSPGNPANSASPASTSNSANSANSATPTNSAATANSATVSKSATSAARVAQSGQTKRGTP